MDLFYMLLEFYCKSLFRNMDLDDLGEVRKVRKFLCVVLVFNLMMLNICILLVIIGIDDYIEYI